MENFTPFVPSGESLLHSIREARRLLAESGDGPDPVCCDGCQAPLSLQSTFCTGCGSRVRFPCPRCQAPCHVGQAHCGSCGGTLGQSDLEDSLASLAASEATARQLQAEERRERAASPLRQFVETRTLREGVVRHLWGRRADDSVAFIKVATGAEGRRRLRAELEALDGIGPHPGVIELVERFDGKHEQVGVFAHVTSDELRFPVAIPRLLEIVVGVLETLEDVHARGWVHADLKPEHIVLRPDQPPLLIDWNIAQRPGPSRFGAFTPMFAAPEQVTGDHVDARTDLYALGVILYLLFTHDRFPAVLEQSQEPEPILKVLRGKKAKNRAFLDSSTWYADDVFSSISKVQHAQQAAPPPAPKNNAAERRTLGAKFLFTSELRRTLDVNAHILWTGAILEVVRRATAVDPDDRFPDATHMRQALTAISAQED